MPIVEGIGGYHESMTAWRQDIHAHPELGFEEHRTADFVAQKLEEFGLEVYRGIGKTGVVGALRVGNVTRSVGLRADMDALPVQEANTFEHRSRHDGKMHACGHDGHTTMLLGAAKYLSESRNFEGQVYFIFQPAEEGIGGAKAMIDDGLFQQFPCDCLFGMHNRPKLPVGRFAVRAGSMMAGGAFFDIDIEGVGAHGARPETSVDPVIVAAQMVAEFMQDHREEIHAVGLGKDGGQIPIRRGCELQIIQGRGVEKPAGAGGIPVEQDRMVDRQAQLIAGQIAERKLHVR